MRSMAKPGGHPLLSLLLRFMRRELSGLLYEQVEEHVLGCEHCQAKLAQNAYRTSQAA